MKHIGSAFFLTFLVSALFSQDIITLLDGRQIEARVIDISPEQIRYLAHDDPRGPILTVAVSEVHNIKYASGHQDFFSLEPLPEPVAKPPTETRPPAPARPAETAGQPSPTAPEVAVAETDIGHALTERTDLRDYRRPSITKVFINRGQAYSEQMIAVVQDYEISQQFDVNPVKYNVIETTSRGMSVGEIKNHLEKYVAPAIVDIWFPFDSVSNTRTIEVVAQRGLFDATDVDVLNARASQRGEAILKDAGIHLLNRSYIAVYDFYNIKRVRTRDSEGYEGSCNVYLFRLDWNAATETRFFNLWDNSSASWEMDFSVKEVASIVRKTQLRGVRKVQSRRGLAALVMQPDEVMFAGLAESLMDNAAVYQAKANDDFKVKTGLVATRPLRAPIGTKEGVHVDQRYFAYELNQRGDGSVREVRKGVIRATNNIVNNSKMATGATGNSEFYQTYGRTLKEGMLLKQSPEWGMSVSAFYGITPSTHYGLLVEGLTGVLLKSTSVKPRSKVYIRINMYKHPDPRSYLAMGVGRDIYVARTFTFTPKIGVNAGMIENARRWGAEAGLSVSLNVLHNVHFIGYGTGIYNRFINKSLLSSLYSGDYYAVGVGLRVQL